MISRECRRRPAVSSSPRSSLHSSRRRTPSRRRSQAMADTERDVRQDGEGEGHPRFVPRRSSPTTRSRSRRSRHRRKERLLKQRPTAVLGQRADLGTAHRRCGRERRARMAHRSQHVHRSLDARRDTALRQLPLRVAQGRPDGRWRVFIDVGTGRAGGRPFAPGFTRMPFGARYAGTEDKAAGDRRLLDGGSRAQRAHRRGRRRAAYADQVMTGTRLHRPGGPPAIGHRPLRAWLEQQRGDD